MKPTIVYKKPHPGWVMGLLSLFLCFSCTEEDLFSADDGYRQKIELDAKIPLASPNSRMTGTSFEDKDVMGVFVVDYEQKSPGRLQLEDNRANNVKYTFDGGANRWQGATAIYWKDKTTPVDIYGYYPFQSTLSSVEQMDYAVKSDQCDHVEGTDMGGYEASDFLWAKETQVQPTDEAISLMYQHLMAGISVVVKPGQGFTEEEWQALEKRVLVENTSLKAQIDLSKGTVSVVEGVCQPIQPFHEGGEYRAVVVPQSVPEGRALISVTVDGVAYALKKEAATTYNSGMLHHFTIVVDRRTPGGDFSFSLIEETITPWVDDPAFHDGIMREYLVVNLKEPGTLESTLQTMNKEAGEIRNLKLCGHVSDKDFFFMRDRMGVLANLNLKEVVIYDNEGQLTNIIPSRALADCFTLMNVIFPDQLKSIGFAAFGQNSLRGPLILPEGLERIEDCAFWHCTSLRGDLILPNSVEFVGRAAFERCAFDGRLSLPHSLKHIGEEAFLYANFTGNLILPENIETIEGGAFIGSRFSGNLVLPQGLTSIGRGAFDGAFPEGRNLEIPEGLEEVKRGTFAHCRFCGELKIPSSLKYIGENAFMENNFSKVIFPTTLRFLGKEAFSGCRRLSGTIRLPDGITEFSDGVFKDCDKLEGVEFSSKIKVVGAEAFAGCTSLQSLIVESEEPPLLQESSFWGVPRDNFSVEVPPSAVRVYQKTPHWREFKRITGYRKFVCRPSRVCALNLQNKMNIILNADADWTVEHLPDWCSLSAMSGSKKTNLVLTITDLEHGASSRQDSIVFRIKGTDYLTTCDVAQYDYQYDEDECVVLQQASKGTGVDIVFVGDGFDAQYLAEGNYMDIVKKEVEHFFALEPYRTYRDYFNVYACVSLSQENGINTLNSYRNTRFNTLYGGCKQNMLPDENLIFDYISQHTPIKRVDMDRTLVVLIPNTEDYIGNTCLYNDGSAISICPPNPDAEQFRMNVQREAGGFGFGKLGDEDIQFNLFAPSSLKADIREGHWRGWFLNLEITNDMKAIPWSHFVFDPRYSDRVDVFEGGAKYTRGVFRSELYSCLNNGIPYYNAISRQSIMKRILEYAGEEFSMEKFYATDSQKWGESGTKTNRSVHSYNSVFNTHFAPRIINKKPSLQK